MAEWEVTNNSTGESFTIRELDGSGGGGGALYVIGAIIGYAILVIGLTIGTINVAKSFPAMLFVLIALDIFAIMPFVGFIIYSIKFAKYKAEQRKLEAECQDEDGVIYVPDSDNEDDDQKYMKMVGKQALSLWKYMVSFLGRFGYIMFYMAIIAYWVLYFCGVSNTLTLSLMFLCMYGMYYFPYMMFSRAKKCNSRFLSVMGLISIYAGVTAAVIGLWLGGEQFALSAPVLLPSVMGVFAILCLPVQLAMYKKHGEGKGPLKAKHIFLILGISLVAVAFVLTIISMNMKR